MRGAEMARIWEDARAAARRLPVDVRLGQIAAAFALDLKALNGAGFAARRAALALSDRLAPLAGDPGDAFDVRVEGIARRPAGFLMALSCPLDGGIVDLFAFEAASPAPDAPGWLRQAGSTTLAGALGEDESEALVYTHPLPWLRHWIAAQWAAFAGRCDLDAVPAPEACAAFVPDVTALRWKPDFNTGRGPRGLSTIRVVGDRAAAEHVARQLQARPPAMKTKLLLVKGGAA